MDIWQAVDNVHKRRRLDEPDALVDAGLNAEEGGGSRFVDA